ncbi:M20/M25/M40 family metallo-hydrolase [Massilia glaciei]|uniref:Aminopeptidase n=1 Tax=Massilia glaciei TaxID=1524097 RepID=A0A2U2HF56_9BURK|nr:M20/M25/M40 family metallo-hydrolase [Massilia glaciei]PWF42678.1 aminopeptidase [Massilia glaciei]
MQISAKHVWIFLACILVAVMATAATALSGILGMPGKSFSALPPPVTSAQADLAERMRRHVTSIASVELNTSPTDKLDEAARYIETTLASAHYTVQQQRYVARDHHVRNIEVSISNTAPGKAPARIFIIGAHYDSAPGAPGANDNGSGTAAVIELARLLKDTPLAEGTEVKFVFFVNEEPPYFNTPGMGSRPHAERLRRQGRNVEAALITDPIGCHSDDTGRQQYRRGVGAAFSDAGNFIAFVGTLESAGLIRRALGAFGSSAQFPSEGLAAPAFVEGVTFSDHASYARAGYPALMVTDTAFLRYPYYHTAHGTPDKLDYDDMARVVTGLSKAIQMMVGSKSM